jgi:B12 binding domain
MSDEEIVRFIKKENIDLVGIGAMTRMAEKAYRVADAIRLTGVPVVMGGPHPTSVIQVTDRTRLSQLDNTRMRYLLISGGPGSVCGPAHN